MVAVFLFPADSLQNYVGNLIMRIASILIVLLTLPALAGDDLGTARKAKKRATIDALVAEVKSLRIEVASLRALVGDLKPSKPEPRKVWKQVRPHIQIEGMIDDGYELVPEDIK